MDDVELTVGDKNLIKSLARVFTYHKIEVPFTGIKDIQKCPNLGGGYKLKEEKKAVKKAKQNEKVRW